MNTLQCPICRALIEIQGAMRIETCPVCGAPLPGAAPSAGEIIDVQAVPVGEEPSRRAEPVSGGGPRVYTHAEDGPGGTFRGYTVRWENATGVPGNSCCGIGCLVLLTFVLLTFIRGCATWF